MRLAARGDVNIKHLVLIGAAVAASACGRRTAPLVDGALGGDQRPADGLSVVAPCALPPGLTTTLPMLAGALGQGAWASRVEVDSDDWVSLAFRRSSAASSSEVALRIGGLKNARVASTRLDASRLPSGVTMEVTWSWCGSRECRIEFMARSSDRQDALEGSVTFEGTPSALVGIQACVRATDSHQKSLPDPTLETWTLDMNAAGRR